MSEIARLEKKLTSATGNEVIRILIQLSEKLAYDQPEKAQNYGYQALNQAQALAHNKLIADSNKALGIIAFYRGNFDQAIIHYQQALYLYDILEDKIGLCAIHNNLGLIANQQGLYQHALNHYLNTLSLDEESGNQYGMACSYTNIGSIYFFQNEIDKALAYTQKSQLIFQKLKNETGIAETLLAMGAIYFSQRKLDQAIENFNQSLEIAHKLNNSYLIVTNLFNIGAIQSETGNFALAEKNLKQALHLYQKVNDSAGTAETFRSLGELYHRQKKYVAAKKFFNQALVLSEKIKLKQTLANTHYQLSKLYEDTRKYKIALTHYKQAIKIDHEIMDAEKHRQIKELEALYEFEKHKKEAEIYRLKNIELAEAVATKDKFFSIIAHDLRTPFSGLFAIIDYLTQRIEDTDRVVLAQIADGVRSSVKATYQLVENLLEWARFQQKHLEFNPGNLCLEKLIKKVLNLYQKNFEEKEIQIDYEINPNLVVYADNRMVLSVLRNLVHNAIKFTRPGGSIKIRALLTEDNMVQISVNDTGTGIEKKALFKLFRIDETYRKEGTSGEKGTGLGLILCKEFVEKNGGKIWVESEPDAGSVFKITLPKGRLNL